jgi:putative SOS response-associated peptidase YedK
MCGRAAVLLDAQSLAVASHARGWSGGAAEAARHRVSGNASPGQANAVIVARARDGRTGRARTLHLATWGIRAPWGLAVNARAETVSSAGAQLRPLLDRSRVAFPVTGYFEWKRAAGTTSRPHFVTRPEIEERRSAAAASGATASATADTTAGATTGATADATSETAGEGSVVAPKVMYLAALHDPATDTYAVLTTPVTNAMAWLHDRLPVILEEDDVDRWIGTTTDGADQTQTGSTNSAGSAQDASAAGGSAAGCTSQAESAWDSTSASGATGPSMTVGATPEEVEGGEVGEHAAPADRAAPIETEKQFLARVLRPYENPLHSHEVSRDVGDVRNRGADLVVPLAEINKRRIGGFFGEGPAGSPSRAAGLKRKSIWDEDDGDAGGNEDPDRRSQQSQGEAQSQSQSQSQSQGQSLAKKSVFGTASPAKRRQPLSSSSPAGSARGTRTKSKPAAVSRGPLDAFFSKKKS